MRAADWFVIVATLLAWTTLIPQIRKLVLTGDPEGISVTWPFIGLVSNAAWTTYLVSRSLWAATPSTVGMVIFYVAVIKVLADIGVPLRPGVVRGAIWASLLATIGLVFGWSVFGLVLGWSYSVQMAPPVVAAYRSSNPRGISIGSWTLITIESGLWGVYGVLLGDVPIQVFALTGLVAGVAILIRAITTRSGAVQDASAPPIATSDSRL